jgi:outer membrane protein assembly factor BamB
MSQSGSLKPITCPSCGAALEITGNALVITCKYCSTQVPVPPEIRVRAQPQTTYTTGADTTSSLESTLVSGGTNLVVVAIVAVVVFVIVAAVALLSSSGGRSAAPPPTSRPRPTVAPTATRVGADVADVVLQFGGEGSGPGQFNEPRALTVDLDGNIYAADFESGRVQKFDPSGKFLWLAQLEGQQPAIQSGGLAADYAGHLYVAAQDKIFQLDATSGKVLKTVFDDFVNGAFTTLAAGTDNRLYGFSYNGLGDQIFQFDPDGDVTAQWKKPLTGIDNSATGSVDPLAVDGLGTFYVVEDHTQQIFIFDKTGKYVSRFAGQGDGLGQLNGANGIAVDGQRHLYVGDNNGIEIFGATGKFLRRIPEVPGMGSAFGIAVDSQGSIYIMTSHGDVLKFRLKASLDQG